MHLDAFRLILATASKGWIISQLDVITAFLAGILIELVYLKVPSELKHIFGSYIRVIKSIYGLKQAARVWSLLLQSFLNKISFHSLPTDDSVMIMVNPRTGIHVVIGIYVDDLLITGENVEEIEKVIIKIKTEFKMKDLGEARNVLGMRILRNAQHLTLDQAKFAAEIVHEFYYSDGYIFETPIEPNATVMLELDPGRGACSIPEINWQAGMAVQYPSRDII